MSGQGLVGSAHPCTCPASSTKAINSSGRSYAAAVSAIPLCRFADARIPRRWRCLTTSMLLRRPRWSGARRWTRAP